jgi:hypothetical protein
MPGPQKQHSPSWPKKTDSLKKKAMRQGIAFCGDYKKTEKSGKARLK